MQGRKKQVKLKLVDWLERDNEESFFSHWLIKMLNQKYDIVYANEPDFIIFNANACGYEHQKYDCVRIGYTVENIRIDYNIADYGINCDFMVFEDRHLRIPLFVCISKDWGECYNFKSRNINNDNKRKFCSYMVSHSGASLRDSLGGFRDRFFDILSKYKQVDSGGMWRNNIGGIIDNHWSDDWRTNKHKWLQNYKFNLCFENSSYPGYLTEKLFDAYNAGCVPIYWGDTSLRVGFADNAGGGFDISDTECIDMRVPEIPLHLIEYKINPKAFINAHNFPNLNALLEEVKRIDNDDKAYEAMRNEPLFLDNFNPNEVFEKKIFEFFDYIFSQGADLAFRRGEGRHLQFYRDRNDKFIDYENLSKDALSVAASYNDIYNSIRKFCRVLKFWKKS